MKIALVSTDPGHAFTVRTPEREGLGGSESALCYLAVALARRGHEVVVLNGLAEATVESGVVCDSLSRHRDRLGAFDAVACINDLPFAAEIAASAGGPRRILAWQHNFLRHSPPETRGAVAAIDGARLRLMVPSEHLREETARDEGVDPGRVDVLRNAVAPAFAGLFADGAPILAAKATPPAGAFTSAPHKGLSALLRIWPEIRRRAPDFTVRVFSSHRIYGPRGRSAFDARWPAVLDECRRTPGVDYVGPVSQTRLAEALKGLSVLVFPNTFPETSCIAALEALAAGCIVVSCALGALPETCGSHGRLLQPGPDGTLSADRFAEMVAGAVREAASPGPGLEARLRAQVDHVAAHGTWDRRAVELEALIRAAA